MVVFVPAPSLPREDGDTGLCDCTARVGNGKAFLEAATRGQVELAVHLTEVPGDGVLGDHELLGDLPIGMAGGGELSDSPLGRCEPVTVGACGVKLPRATRVQLIPGVGGQGGGASCAGELQPPLER